MSKKELKKLVEAGFIPGIYNFCDRWCEKCTQQTKCMSFILGKKMEEKLGTTLQKCLYVKKENIWAYLKDVFDITYEILHDLAEERGIDMEDIYAAEDVEKGLWPDEYKHDLQKEEYDDLEMAISEFHQVYTIYESLSEECLETIFAILAEKEWVPDSYEEKEAEDALNKVNWYLDIIQLKIKRALLGQLQCNDIVREQNEYDYNGSAKIALLCMEASDVSWEILKKYCPQAIRKNIMHIQVVLGQLIRDIDEKFPDARKFQRPGFDIHE